MDLSIYLVTDAAQVERGGRDLVDVVVEAVAGGVTAVQVREKHADVHDVVRLVEALSRRLPAHVALFVNDRVDVFLAARARGARVTGVHVGQQDLPVEEVRALVGPDAVIGLTANTPEDLAAAETSPAGVGYVGIGIVRQTGSKFDAPPTLGVKGVAALARSCALPAVAIGGIVPDDLRALRSGGLAGAAVVSWVCASPDPRTAAAELARAWAGEPRPMTQIPRVLSIAGTDPTGGAGIQADLKSIAASGGYGMAVVTTLVAQNTTGVRSIHTPPLDFLIEQLRAVSDDVTIDAVKLGMLFDASIIAAVGDWLGANRPPVVVLDPVMVASSGDRLLSEDAESALRELLRSADLVTPNIPELAALLGEDPALTWDHALRQARDLAARHDVQVLMKGGHLDDAESSDALVTPGGDVDVFTAARIDTPHTHGTGCSLSSAIATLQPRIGDWAESVQQAKTWLTESIAAADQLHVGHGNGPVSHFAGLWRRGGVPAITAEQIAGDWWDGVADTRAAIDDLEFVRGLSDGTLEQESFAWYLAQDALYLREYSRVLAEASKLAPTPAEQAFWASSAHGAIATELELHASWLPTGAVFDAEPSATTTAYVDHLLAIAARGGYAVLIAAVLPCFWIYVDVGTRLAPHATSDHPYAAWLRTYADPEFCALNDQAIEIVTRHAAATDPTTRERMRRAFVTSSRHELQFFAAPMLR
ncbi:bifunctional hydroxymethylpyrimidine kinase/phosphomethylpyrimidine kinase [Aeromicrobium sp. CF3.5]|uniref:bifunctional hydroxymethylpyrimidine kinase/phosphomethylpyrimidine kinase n=1 Tax=Aeromicrobium sp. CF3.5 TaxID=3373078 RepID=UPI003EE50E70